MNKLFPALAAAATIVAAVPAAASAATLSAFPAPDTPTASPTTQISFRGASAVSLAPIAVTGSRSGAHSGSDRSFSDGSGFSFIPAKPFTPGERVTVKTRIGGYGFTIAPTTVQREFPPAEPTDHGNGAVRRFASRPDLVAPAVEVTVAKPGIAPGDVFLAPKTGRGQNGPMIVDDGGQPIWFDPLRDGDLATDFRVQTYDGRPVLTWWQGKTAAGDGDGKGVIYDDHYRLLKTVKAGNGYGSDLHEFNVTPQGQALLTAYHRVRMDLSRFGGSKNGIVIDCVVQEIDIETGLVEFEWHSLGNVDPSNSYVPAPKNDEWDYFHVNSVALDADGNLIISARNTWTIYKVSATTGKVIWRLGGKKSSFKEASSVRTAWQHSARPLPGSQLQIYDNGASPAIHKQSRALRVQLNTTTMTATLVSAFAHSDPPLLSASQGSVQLLDNGDTFVGFGSQPYFSEFSPTGELLFDGHIARGNDNYRAFRFPWSGTPSEPARIAATSAGGRVKVSASWNGATDVASWALLAGRSKTTLKPVKTTARRGFETTIDAPAAPYVAMRAFDAAGAALATTAVVQPKPAPKAPKG